MKQKLRIFASFVMALIMLAGCAGSAQPAPTNPPAPPAESQATAVPEIAAAPETVAEAKPENPISITLMASQNWIKEVDRELFQKFQDKTGIEVKTLLTPDGGYETLLGSALSGGSNAIDIFMGGVGIAAVSSGVTEVAVDLSTEPWVANLENWAVTANTYDGKLLGFSTWGVDYEGILYNKTYFQENGLKVPKTWDEFIALLEQVAALGKIPLYEGINGTWHTASWFYCATPAIIKEDPDLFERLNASKDNKYTESAAAIKALGQIQQVLSEKRYYTNDGQAEDWFGSYPSLTNRETVMMLTYSAYAAELKSGDYNSQDEWGMFPVPLCDETIGVSNGGGISKYINKNSRNVEACKEFLRFLAEPENLEAYYAGRSDLITSSFKGVKSVKPTTATTDMQLNSSETPIIMLLRTVLFWAPDQYKLMQGMAEKSVTPVQYLESIDEYRAEMFEASEE
ncbi:MAG: extracellular solute-binding protein [Clostridiales bacterium]|jgi:raffinose/stachyose/melibiose transport system substrate-binding protein|nr:extracellular solute-binding protein [Clostridiales bacterium]